MIDFLALGVVGVERGGRPRNSLIPGLELYVDVREGADLGA